MSLSDEEKSTRAKQKPTGRKGGAQFPRLSLEKALSYSKKLVSKTHTGPLPSTSILPGVFGANGSRGQVRAAALKQYGLLEGTAKAYKASALAKSLDAAGLDEQSALLCQALVKPNVFRQLLETFQNDRVTKAKIEQRAKGLEVHPDSAEECARLFIESAVSAKVGSLDGDSIVLRSTPPTSASSGLEVEVDAQDEGGEETETLEGEPEAEARDDPPSVGQLRQPQFEVLLPKSSKAQINLTLNVDSSSDPDKLEKQLKLLKQFGMI